MGFYDKYAVKAAVLATSATKMFEKAHKQLTKANDILAKTQTDIEEELNELKQTYDANQAAIAANAQVMENLKPFLVVLPNENKTNER